MKNNDVKNKALIDNNIDDIDYKNVELLNKFTTAYGKIIPKKRTSNTARIQREVARAIKRARIMGFLPFVVE